MNKDIYQVKVKILNEGSKKPETFKGTIKKLGNEKGFWNS